MVPRICLHVNSVDVVDQTYQLLKTRIYVDCVPEDLAD